MEKHKLLRTDQDGKPKRPINFHGRLIAQASDEGIPRPIAGGRMDDHEGRWDSVFVYEVDGGNYLVGIAHQTNWHGESDVKIVHECKTLEKVIDRVKFHAPYCAGVIEERLCQPTASGDSK